jgi:hypothetical protein
MNPMKHKPNREVHGFVSARQWNSADEFLGKHEKPEQINALQILAACFQIELMNHSSTTLGILIPSLE